MSEVKRYCIDDFGSGMRELEEGPYVVFDDFDAQRLRADTAEAESARKDGVIEDLMQSNSDMTTCLAAAEQRIAEMAGLLKYVRTKPGFFSGEFVLKIDAALNPNPEAESHE